LTRLGLEPTIYRIQGEHLGHYTTNAVQTSATIYKYAYSNKQA
jgi:hypothetical protein